jgi:hypothetical protein
MLVGIVAAIDESCDRGGWTRSLLTKEHDTVVVVVVVIVSEVVAVVAVVAISVAN